LIHMKQEWITVGVEGIRPVLQGESLQEKLEDGWEKDGKRDTLGTDRMRVIPLIKFDDEEEREVYYYVEPPETGKLLDMDMNLLTVPIISYDEEKQGAENQYKILAQRGFKEVHKTSAKAVMQLKTPGMPLEPWLNAQFQIVRSLEDVVKDFRSIWGFTLDVQEIRPWLEAVGYKVPVPDVQ